MTRGPWVCLLGVLLLLLAVPLPSPAADGALPAWKGFASGLREAHRAVVETPEAWTALWQRAFGTPAPAVDFERHAVACVFLGHDADWLYGISFGAPFRRGGAWVIPWGMHPLVLELAGPFRARGQYHLQVYERRPGGPMVLEEAPPDPLLR